MKTATVQALVFVPILVLTAASAYWLGQMDGRDVLAPQADPTARSVETASPERSAPASKRILYYRHPMGFPDVSPTPKKDSMGMNYIPVFESDRDEGAAGVKIDLDKVQRLGVRTALVERRELTRAVRAPGTVQFDERRQHVVTTRTEGWIEALHADATGQAVRAGDPLVSIYSPELVLAQEEYLVARRRLDELAGADRNLSPSTMRLADLALGRLRTLGMTDGFVRRLEREGTVARTVTLRAPASGIVMEKTAVTGMRVMPGEPLFRLVDLSTVWIVADVAEAELGLVGIGQDASIVAAAFPGQRFQGRVDFIYPTLSRETRTGRVRIQVPNPDRLLRADMFVQVELRSAIGIGRSVAVPASSLLDSGARQVVLLARGDGRFEPRQVTPGNRVDDYVEILDGVAEGETVVVGATFLIDAESNLRAALSAFTAGLGAEAKP
jgi:Cu(I)/Ag(I) efflux system membrane fusion protein